MSETDFELELLNLSLRYTNIEDKYTDLQKYKFMRESSDKIIFDTYSMKSMNLKIKDYYKLIALKFKTYIESE